MIEQAQTLGSENIGVWPLPLRVAMLVGVLALVLGAGYYLDTRVRQDELAQARQSEQGLRTSFEAKQKQAASLDMLRAQLADMRDSLDELLRQLPNETEIDALNVDVSQAGLAAGLEFELFRPQGERAEDFIAVLPIEMRAAGTFHEVGDFISSVAALPRIVTQHNIRLTPRDGDRDDEPTEADQQLTVEMLARTYRYLEEDGDEQ